MTRPDVPDDPSREATVLATVDRALERGPSGEAGAERRQIEDLALALRDLSPKPPHDLYEALDRRLAEGFPRRRGVIALGRRRRRPAAGATGRRAEASRAPVRGGLAAGARRLLSPPALAASLSLLLAIVIAVPVLTERQDANPVTGSPTTAPNPADAPSGTAEEPLSGTVDGTEGEGRDTSESRTGSAGSLAPNRRERRVERTGSLTLSAPEDRLEQVADAVVRTVDRHRGIVLSSSVSTGEDASGGGTFSLRVPVGDLNAVMRELSGLGAVRARSQTGEDVTASFASAGERLAEERAERQSLLRRLERSDSTTEAEAIRARLRMVGARIRSIRTELQGLRTRTDYAAISLSLVSEEADSGPAGSTELAFDDFVDSMVGSLNFVIRLLGVLIPLGVVAVPAVLAWRALRRRWREGALAG